MSKFESRFLIKYVQQNLEATINKKLNKGFYCFHSANVNVYYQSILGYK